VFGDLADLVPTADVGGPSAPEEPSETDLLAATEAALAALATSYGSLAARHRRLVRSTGTPGPPRAVVPRSILENGMFRLKRSALGLADRSHLIARIARRYAGPSELGEP